MTDRELLEAAAKAAGIKIEWERDPAFVQERWQAMVPCGWVGQPSQREWNPLREDGDAFRLAVKLGLFNGPEFFHFRSIERFAHQDKDECFVTRRAITRAAAEIGRARDGGEMG